MLSVGKILKGEREKRGISLPMVEKEIKIREKFLKAIEEDNWDFFSSKVYITGIIKNYANFLGLDSRKILAFFRRDYEKKDEVKFKKKISSKYLASETKKLALFGLGLVFAFFFTYFGYQLKLYFTPPKITILSPKTDKVLKGDRVKIIGKTDKDVMINIFGERVFQNQEGIFEYNFPLKKGKNELVIEVVGANGRKAVFRRIYLRE